MFVAPISGGAIFAQGNVVVTIENCKFSECFSAAKPESQCERGCSYGAAFACLGTNKVSISEKCFISNYIYDKKWSRYTLYFENSTNAANSNCFFNNSESYMFDLAFNMNGFIRDDEVTYSLKSWCFEGKNIPPIEENLSLGIK